MYKLSVWQSAVTHKLRLVTLQSVYFAVTSTANLNNDNTIQTTEKCGQSVILPLYLAMQIMLCSSPITFAFGRLKPVTKYGCVM